MKQKNKKEQNTPLMLQTKIETEKEKLEIYNDSFSTNVPQPQHQKQGQLLSEKKNETKPTKIQSLVDKASKKLDSTTTGPKQKGLRVSDDSTNRTNAKLIIASTDGLNLVKDKKLTITTSATEGTFVSKLIPTTKAVLDKENIGAKRPILSTTKSSSLSSLGKNMAYRLRD